MTITKLNEFVISLRAELAQANEKNKWLMLNQGHSLECYEAGNTLRSELAQAKEEIERLKMHRGRGVVIGLRSMSEEEVKQELSALRAELAEAKEEIAALKIGQEPGIVLAAQRDLALAREDSAHKAMVQALALAYITSTLSFDWLAGETEREAK